MKDEATSTSNSKRQITIGVTLIVSFFVFLGLIAGSAFLPGYAGELGAACLALVTSPFIMEPALFFLALTFLFAINGWRRNRDGDDWVTLDEQGRPIREE